MQPSESVAGIGHNNPPSYPEQVKDDAADMVAEITTIAERANAFREEKVKDGDLKDDEDLSAAIAIGKDARSLANRIDEERKKATAPLRDQTTEINAYFNSLKDRMDRIVAAFSMIADKVARRQEAAERREQARLAQEAEKEAVRKAKEAEKARHSTHQDVARHEAEEAQARADVAANQAMVKTGPVRTEAGTVSRAKTWTFKVDDYQKIPHHVIVAQMSVADIDKAIRSHVRKFQDREPVPGVTIIQDTKARLR